LDAAHLRQHRDHCDEVIFATLDRLILGKSKQPNRVEGRCALERRAAGDGEVVPPLRWRRLACGLGDVEQRR
jgi:hypothetical protein